MRILQISSASSFGGGERYLVDLSNALVDRGHDLYAAVRPRSPLISQLRVSAKKIRILPLRNALDVPSARALGKFVKQHEIQVVHAHMARDYSLAAYAARSRPNTKFFVTRHVLFPLNRLQRHVLGRAARVIAVSAAVASHLRSQQIVNDDRIALVPNGVDIDRFARARLEFHHIAFLQSRGLPTDRWLIGSIGELRTLKRHDDFIRAAAIVAQALPKSHFVVAGVDTSPSGETRKQLEVLASQLGISGRVHFLGWMDDAENLLCALDVFVSASETESFGLAIAEAMATGTAVVATATEGARELIEDQKTGLLVPIGDVERMAESIKVLLVDEDGRKRLGTQAKAAVNARFSLSRMVDEIEKIYGD